jgi:DNA-binding NtrC family response regulator
MTTPVLTSPVSDPIPDLLKKKRVLLVDASTTSRELRAETMRKMGVDVDCAADISEARSWWRADLYNLVLMSVENALGHRDKFCADVRSATPPQQLAFLVGKPGYLANLPNADEEFGQKDVGPAPADDIRTALAAFLKACISAGASWKPRGESPPFGPCPTPVLRP